MNLSNIRGEAARVRSFPAEFADTGLIRCNGEEGEGMEPTSRLG